MLEETGPDVAYRALDLFRAPLETRARRVGSATALKAARFKGFSVTITLRATIMTAALRHETLLCPSNAEHPMPGQLTFSIIARSAASFAVASLALASATNSSFADEFFLKNGKRVEGRLLNPDERPRVKYEIRLTSGGRTSLSADEVLRFVPESPDKRRYQELLPKMPQTADGNWKMAEWCRKHGLLKDRTFHLEQVVQLDPNHEQAHRALGHMFVDGKWTARDELMQARGYVKHKGSWKLPDEVEIEVERRRVEFAEKQWRKQIRLWRRQLAKNPGAVDNIRGIFDPLAAAAVADLLADEEEDRGLRHEYIEVLGRLDSPVAVTALIRCALLDADADTRHLCLERLPERGRGAAVSAFTAALKSNEPRLVTAAGEGLTFLKEPEVIPQLIDALVTEHKFKVSEGNPGQIGTSFGSSSDGSFGGTGLSTGGGGTRVETKAVQNRSVLEALLSVTAGVNYRYDQIAWRRWLAESTAPEDLDLRRRD